MCEGAGFPSSSPSERLVRGGLLRCHTRAKSAQRSPWTVKPQYRSRNDDSWSDHANQSDQDSGSNITNLLPRRHKYYRCTGRRR